MDTEIKPSPEMSREEFKIKQMSIIAELDVIVQKYDIHGIVFSFGVSSGDNMKGAMGVLGCPQCCTAIFDKMLENQGRVYAEIEEATKAGGRKVH